MTQVDTSETDSPPQVELCRQLECDEAAQVLIDVELVWFDENGIENLGVHTVAMCRLHALEEQEKQGQP